MDTFDNRRPPPDWPLHDFEVSRETQEFDDSHGAPQQMTRADSKETLDDISLVGLSRDKPLRLLTPFYLSEGQTMWIVSPHIVDSFRYNYVNAWHENPPLLMKIYCPDPIKLQLTNHSSWLVPRAPLLPAFARGWEKLPNELKANVLKFNLTWNHRVSFNNYNNHLLKLFHHLRMTPEIAEISRELFFGKNEFRFQLNGGFYRDFTNSLWQSRPFAQIHRVCLDVMLDQFFKESHHPLGKFLHSLANVRHIILRFKWDLYSLIIQREEWDEDDASKWLGATKLILGDKEFSLASDGYIVFCNESFGGWGWSGRPNDTVRDQMEEMVKSRITFHPKAQ